MFCIDFHNKTFSVFPVLPSLPFLPWWTLDNWPFWRVDIIVTLARLSSADCCLLAAVSVSGVKGELAECCSNSPSKQVWDRSVVHSHSRELAKLDVNLLFPIGGWFILSTSLSICKADHNLCVMVFCTNHYRGTCSIWFIPSFLHSLFMWTIVCRNSVSTHRRLAKVFGKFLTSSELPRMMR